ncbi:glycosyltransferase family 2 protein [Lactobacillus sp. 3B(2020)]|uniref:glycosyltransferase family 2 protein n=1 Tax=Lactobacillus sp. 3B(2020) TaxID=2695882 RepID=UPI0015DE9911|nr:glycosyltransferase family 2 protein [Lactobacillus sp. 3B(2020)]QLL70089.1 glycosyltransferase [Lactobacillus sp. 3B(2020)]
MENRVDAIVVTYNRLDELKKCLDALFKQTYTLNKIIVVDNNSDDGTYEYLMELNNEHTEIFIKKLEQNLGGAGGFNQGLKEFVKDKNANYAWVMDSDTLPKTTALEKMIAKSDLENIGFLCSNVRWVDGSPAVMNIPRPAKNWNYFVTQGATLVQSASFVSMMFPKKVIKKVGYPITDFFIWGDDVEFSRRIRQAGYNGFMISDSIVTHDIKQNIGTSIEDELAKNRLNRYYFGSRNSMFIAKKYLGMRGILKTIVRQTIIQPINIIRKSKCYKLYKIIILYKGTFAGFKFNPKIENIN